MFENAILALQNNDPELALQEIHLAMHKVVEPNQLELAISDEIIRTTDFLTEQGWVA